MFENINEIAVIVSAILAVAIGSIWYSSLLFGKMWTRSIGTLTNSESEKGLLIATTKSFFVYVVTFFILGKFIIITRNIEEISLFGLILMLLVFVWAHLLTPVIWEKKPISYFLVHAGYITTVILVSLAVLSYWPW